MLLLQHVQDSLNLWQIELLEESVESGISLAPVFGFTLGGATFFLFGVFTVNGLLDSDNPLILQIEKFKLDQRFKNKIFEIWREWNKKFRNHKMTQAAAAEARGYS